MKTRLSMAPFHCVAVIQQLDSDWTTADDDWALTGLFDHNWTRAGQLQGRSLFPHLDVVAKLIRAVGCNHSYSRTAGIL